VSVKKVLVDVASAVVDGHALLPKWPSSATPTPGVDA
jgi:hypothetical protein